MGATAALLFSPLATAVQAFSPQVCRRRLLCNIALQALVMAAALFPAKCWACWTWAVMFGRLTHASAVTSASTGQVHCAFVLVGVLAWAPAVLAAMHMPKLLIG